MNEPKTKTILYAEDEPALREPIRALLSAMSYRVVTAADGEEALAAARLERPDLMILDVRMPKLTGFEVLERLAGEPGLAGVPVLFLTAEKKDEAIRAGYAKGVVYYLTKPFRVEQVRNAVRYFLEDLSEEERTRLEAEL